MPRYRFAWDNIDPQLRLRLCGGQPDDPAETAPALRHRYGARPKERFVAEQWPVLRDDWLAGAEAARSQVVATLRSFGLGDVVMPVDTADEQLAYLRSCRNGLGLRRVVLAAFIELGESAGARTKPSAPSTEWDGFERALGRVLGGLGEDQYLILSVRGTGAKAKGHPAGSSYFVQFAGLADGLRAEAVANTYLAADDRLSPEAQVRLVELGWQPPSHLPGAEQDDPTGSTNYYHDYEAPLDAAALAGVVGATLRDVYRAERPDHLEYRAFHGSGELIDLPELGVEHEANAVAVDLTSVEGFLPQPQTAEELRAAVAQALVPLIGETEILYDEDGDIPLRFGSTVVYVRALDQAPVVRVFALLLRDLTPSAALIEVLNDLNQSMLFGKVYWDGGGVVMTVDVPGSPFVASHLVQAILMVGQTGDEYDDELQEQFGGRTMFGAHEPRTPDDGVPTDAPVSRKPEPPAPGYL